MKKFALSAVILLAVSALMVPAASAQLQLPTISVSPTSIDFGQVPVNSGTWVTVTVTNSGDATLNITAVKTTIPFGDDTRTMRVAPHSSATFQVFFAAITAQTYTGTCTILSNAANAPRLDIPLTGEGI